MAATAPIITCPRCQKKFKGKPELFGKRIRCPGCEKPFVVPSPDAKIDEKQLQNVLDFKEEEPEADVKAAIQIKQARQVFQEDEGPANYDIRRNADDDVPRCPNCANEMESADAVVCLHCGYNTSDRTWGRTEVVKESTGQDRFMWLLPGLLCLLGIFLQVIGCLYYCLVLPDTLTTGWEWMGAEACKMWTVIFALFDMWPLGMFAYWRLVLHPDPPEREAD
jgi:hypothetical protein